MSGALTCGQAYVFSERSGVPILAIIMAINSRDCAMATGNNLALVLAKGRFEGKLQAGFFA